MSVSVHCLIQLVCLNIDTCIHIPVFCHILRHTCAHLCALSYTWMHACPPVVSHTQTYKCTHALFHTWAHTCASVYISSGKCGYPWAHTSKHTVCTCTLSHTYVQTVPHTLRHAHMHSYLSSLAYMPGYTYTYLHTASHTQAHICTSLHCLIYSGNTHIHPLYTPTIVCMDTTESEKPAVGLL